MGTNAQLIRSFQRQFHSGLRHDPLMLKYGGFIAWGLFLISMGLAGKNQFLNRLFGSVARQYRWHHVAGLVCLLYALVHTVIQFLVLDRADWTILFDFSDPGILSAYLSLAFLATSVLSSFFRFKRYWVWYGLHMLLLPAVLLISVHSIMMTAGQATAYVSWFLTISSVVLLLLFWYEKKAGTSLVFSVVSHQKIAENITELNLVLEKAAKNLKPFSAGSIVYLRFSGKKFSHTWHPFSVASCRFDDKLRLLIKGFGSDTFQLQKIPPETTVSIKGPFREITPDFQKHQIWIAGGIGIATFAGFSHCIKMHKETNVTLLYFMRSKKEAVSGKILGLDKSLKDRFQIKNIIDTQNDLTGLTEMVRKSYIQKQTQVFTSGPPVFMKKIRKKLMAAGVKYSDIHTEEFTPW